MNDAHLKVLASGEWAAMLKTNLVPWLDEHGELGDDVLEIGPGPGLTTDLLRSRTLHLTAVEIDSNLASALAARLQGMNVDVIHGDATHLGLPSDRFSGASCFGMLHHVPSSEQQDQVFAEIYRVLRPNGPFVGTDGVDDERTRQFHLDDDFLPIDPAALGPRLRRAGFIEVDIEMAEFEFRFHATKPGT
jgi:SAM-dependent methyltransferase